MCSGELAAPSASLGRLVVSPIPFRFGPMVPVAPGTPWAVWQAMQPFCWNSVFPLLASPVTVAPPDAAGLAADAAGGAAGAQAASTRLAATRPTGQRRISRRITRSPLPALA